MTLVNCPFHALAQDYTQLVCGMNLDLMTGLVDSVQTSGLDARLEPGPGQCCVRLSKAAGGA
jgi:predicted ArsR family transcriptional regulator